MNSQLSMHGWVVLLFFLLKVNPFLPDLAYARTCT